MLAAYTKHHPREEQGTLKCSRGITWALKSNQQQLFRALKASIGIYFYTLRDICKEIHLCSNDCGASGFGPVANFGSASTIRLGTGTKRAGRLTRQRRNPPHPTAKVGWWGVLRGHAITTSCLAPLAIYLCILTLALYVCIFIPLIKCLRKAS